MSTQIIAARKWRIAIVSLAVLLLAGTVLIVLIAAGIGNPPRAANLTFSAANPEAIGAPMQSGGFTHYPGTLLDTLPATLILQATQRGETESAWGIWLETSANEPPLYLLIDGQGYTAAGMLPELEWRQFIHLRPDTNTLYLHIDAERHATFRINDEIAWTGSLADGQAIHWGIALQNNPRLEWHAIRVYTD